MNLARRSLVTMLVIVFLFGCTNGIDRSQIEHAEKLPSPYGDEILYCYSIESSMAFGSPITVIKILLSDKDCDYTDGDFFRLDNDYPFFIKWKNKDTLQVKCLVDGGGELADKQPIKKDTIKWRDWTFEVEYYSMFSAGAETKYLFDGYSADNNFITFKSKEDTLVFKNDEVQISLDTNHIHITQFKIDTFRSKLGLSFSYYDLQNRYNKNDFLNRQPFLRVKL
jgi:hypothetical protein